MQTTAAFYPLTALQESMVLASIRQPRIGLYVLHEVCVTAERVDFDSLRAAYQSVVARHTALRTRFVREEHRMWQRVEEVPEAHWEETHAESCDDFLRRDRQRGFDFDLETPERFTALHTPEGVHLIWTIHHALVDGTSFVVLWQELFAIYEARLGGEVCSLPSAPPFHKLLDQAGEEFSKRDFGSTGRTTGFIVDRLFPALKKRARPGEERFEEEQVAIPDDLSRQLSWFASQNSITTHTLIQGAWALLLGRYSGSNEVVFGVIRSGRESAPAGPGDMVGPLIDTFPFTVNLPRDMLTREWLKELRRQWLEARPGRPAPFDTLVSFSRELVGNTLRRLGGSWDRRQVTLHQRTDIPLTLVAVERPVLSAKLCFDAEVFSNQTITRLGVHFSTLLNSFIDQPGAPLVELRMLPEQEELWLTRELNKTDAPYALDHCAHQNFENRARQAPERTALEHGDIHVSYGELDHRANLQAARLRSKGVGPEDIAAVSMSRSPALVVSILAVLKAGAAFLPIDPSLPPERIDAMIDDARPKFVLRDVDQSLSEIEASPADPFTCPARPENAAYVIYTSGSTGKPKAVVVTHRSLVNYVTAARAIMGITEHDRRLQFASLGSDMFIAEIFNFLSSGGTLVFPAEQRWESVQGFLRVLDETKATMTGMPSTWWQECVSTMLTGRHFIPTSLRTLSVGMERVNPLAFQNWRRLVGDRVTWRNVYGPTETTAVATMYEAGTSAWECAAYIPIGRPLPNVRVYVLDDEMRPAPVGVTGQLYIGGEGVARGYLNNPELTAERFIPDPFSDDRIYKTGDLVFVLPDGNLVFAGRIDRQIKIRGHRIELEEVETVLGWHPSVVHAAVTVEGENGGERLRAFVVGAAAEPALPDELRLHMSRHLPDHMIPFAFTALREMPLTPSGKIDRQALSTIKPPPIELRAVPNPRTEAERSIANLWVEVLGIRELDAEHIGFDDNFFELGGNSLQATRLIAAISQDFGCELSFVELARVPTVAGMAFVLERERHDVGEDFVLVQHAQGALPPLICVSSAADDPWRFRHLAHQLTEEQPVFVLPNPIRPGETLQEVRAMGARLRESIQKLRAHGPYVLAGYCLGGVAVFEAAQLLVASGETVALIALFDTPTPGYPKVVGSWKSYLRRFGEWVSSPRSVRLRDVAAHAHKVGQLIGETAKAIYAPQPLNVSIAVFMAEDELVSSSVLEDPRLSWRHLTTRSFHVERVRGSHATVLAETYAAELAGKLSGLMSQACVTADV